MALNEQSRAAIRRLTSDFKEIQSSPIGGVSAAPLEDNIFEWHCNFEGPKGSSWEDTIFHVVLFFPENYPAKSPSAEFLPKSFRPIGGAQKEGKKGTQVCLSIFSDFATYHPEWANEKGTGWSPSYTVQTVLVNLVSFLNEMASQSSYYANQMKDNIAVSRSLNCTDCGHTHSKPFPELPKVASESKKEETSASKVPELLTCYVSKVRFDDNVTNTSPIFGYGIARSGSSYNPSLTSPCEIMTHEAFTELSKSGKIESVMREELHYWLPLFITPAHGALIKKYFEASIVKITEAKSFDPKLVMQVLPKLLNSTVVTFMNGTTHTSERALHGYFAFHRLFLWAVTEYPALSVAIEKKIKDFVASPDARTKKNTPNVGEWLALLLVSKETSWQTAAQAYLTENFERNVMWYLREKKELGNATGVDEEVRLSETFRLTKVSRDLLAFQVLFLDIAKPKEMDFAQICARYDANYGLPTEQMEKEMKDAVKKIKEIKSYPEWFAIIKVPLPGKSQLCGILVKSVQSAATKDGYFDKPGGNRGGGGGGRGGGRGGRGRGY